MVDKKLLDILACPICKGKLIFVKHSAELVCKNDKLAFPIRNDIPVMLESEARNVNANEEI